jgi:hypothetical protein
MTDRRTSARIFFILGAFGLASFLGMLSKASLENIRPVDVVHLIGTGMCFGGAIVALVFFLRSDRSR